MLKLSYKANNFVTRRNAGERRAAFYEHTIYRAMSINSLRAVLAPVFCCCFFGVGGWAVFVVVVVVCFGPMLHNT